ncbi:hypothetical protein ADU59_00600 (plasmid) [Pararhizobium polonicum]|uniref:Uncharacterized protein n=1 Tax=Pararhizobium polonicum TaxID=1612624 RepID=A0A1C7P8P5_9HYPH|nr:hypothetical protein ADU59_00600 [Pararhizobium polonicum]
MVSVVVRLEMLDEGRETFRIFRSGEGGAKPGHDDVWRKTTFTSLVPPASSMRDISLVAALIPSQGDGVACSCHCEAILQGRRLGRLDMDT